MKSDYISKELLDVDRYISGPVIDKLKKYYDLDIKEDKVYIDSEDNIGKSLQPTSPKQVPYVTPSNDLAKAFKAFFNDSTFNKQSSFSVTPPQPAEYDDMDEKDNVKIAEKFPMFGFASLLDEVLEGFGGVQEIIRCDWREDILEGEVVCLMKDWRVFRYYLKQHEFATLSHVDRVSKVNRECMVHEDVDDWGHWEELGGSREEQEKKALQEKQIQENQSVYGEKMNEAMNAFFNGDPSALAKIMAKNSGNKGSILEAEA